MNNIAFFKITQMTFLPIQITAGLTISVVDPKVQFKHGSFFRIFKISLFLLAVFFFYRFTTLKKR